MREKRRAAREKLPFSGGGIPFLRERGFLDPVNILAE